jgi:hypothetical protein
MIKNRRIVQNSFRLNYISYLIVHFKVNILTSREITKMIADFNSKNGSFLEKVDIFGLKYQADLQFKEQY